MSLRAVAVRELSIISEQFVGSNNFRIVDVNFGLEFINLVIAQCTVLSLPG